MHRTIRFLAVAGLLASCATSTTPVTVTAAITTAPVTPVVTTTTTTSTPATSTTTRTVPTTAAVAATTATVAAASSLPALPADLDTDNSPVFVDDSFGIGRIEIPKLGVDQRLQDGWDLPTLDRGPGLMPGSPRPGQLGNMVVAGHRTSKTRPFRYIDTLEIGDEVVFTVAGRRVVYTVTEHLIVNPDAIWITDPTVTATATMFACHPPGSTAQRWVTRLVLAS